MPVYNYVVWFRDHNTPPGDEDDEWPACFFIEAAHNHEAKSWGDKVAANYSARNKSYEFLRSYLDTDFWAIGSVPPIAVGEDISDKDIGW